ncbi:MAG: hypothetical protein O9289_05895 [Rhodobacteraceae bacterium]|jgi:hypothetical protein|nr:hypothetical protein [Paracoccaceae bacterium]MCZ8082719.1 hypothetical protein [Paracoccaceae bacterium]
MKAYITREAFLEARTPESLKELLERRNAEGVTFAQASEKLHSLDASTFVDTIFGEARCNADVSDLMKEIANEAFDAGKQILRIVELWRAQSTMGKSAVLIEADGKLGVLVIVGGEVVVRHAGCIASERLNGRDPRGVAFDLLRTLKARAA